MNTFGKKILSKTLFLLIASSGFATLSWEVIWQIKATLALGVSAWGTALTLAVIMGGMSLGGLLMGMALRRGTTIPALRLYGSLEIIAGVAGLFLNTAWHVLEKIDTWMYTILPNSPSLFYLFGIVIIFAIPTLCIGATLPVFNLLAQQLKVSLSKLYGINTLGAGIGTLIVALLLIPLFGMTHTIYLIASLNIFIGIIAFILPKPKREYAIQKLTQDHHLLTKPTAKEIVIVFVTGFTTFALEIAWFRSFANLYPNTTDVFAIMLACLLIALGLAAKRVTALKQKKRLLGTQLAFAGLLVLLITPIIERLDSFLIYSKKVTTTLNTTTPTNLSMYSDWLINPVTFQINSAVLFTYVLQLMIKFAIIYILIVPPIRFLGVAFPWILDNNRSTHQVGKLYVINTFASIIGAITAGWVLLPVIGFAKTAWLAGVIIIMAGILISPRKKRYIWAALGILALSIAIYFETGIGRFRVNSYYGTDTKGTPAKLLKYFEGPDASVSAVEYQDGTRALLINSSLATWESGNTYRPSTHYMAWMGHLPMLASNHPDNALVICFGTGQTANAVREENPTALDIVDVNHNVFKLGMYFRSNKNVLTDARVKAIVMDGRAYLRRTTKSYDVITLEPMPPLTLGVNALYSKEFYQLAHQKLTSDGIIAQWLPFHAAAPLLTASIAKTFIEVFPNAILWIDSDSNTGILLASKNDNANITSLWPGFLRNTTTRDMSQLEVMQHIALNSQQLKQYANYGEIITDDNQLLSYGKALHSGGGYTLQNFALLHLVNHNVTLPQLNTRDEKINRPASINRK